MKRTNYRGITAMLVRQLLLIINRYLGEGKVANRNTLNEIERAINYFNESYSTEINIEEYAKSRHMSVSSYFWGEMLIADFDMIDKYLIDASQLLRNINEIKELEADLSYLTPEQERIIAFWRSLGTNETLSEQKRRFLEIWNKLPLIYNEFRSRLLSDT